MNQLNEIHWTGQWWITDRPSVKLSGLLRYDSSDRITLQLIGSPRDIENFNTGIPFPSDKTVNGIAETGTLCTLMNIIEYRDSKLTMLYLFVGAHFMTKNEIVFSSLKVRFLNFENWMCQDPYEINESLLNHSCAYRAPNGFDISLQKPRVRIETAFAYHMQRAQFQNVEMEHKAYIKVTPERNEPFDYYRQVIVVLKDLLTLLIGKVVYHKELYGYMINAEGLTVEVGIVIAESRIAHADDLRCEDMIAPFPKVRERLPSILDKWFESYGRMKSVYNLFFGALSNPYLFQEFRFLSLIQALESFHRIIKGGKYIDDSSEEWKGAVKLMIASIPSSLEKSHKQSLEKKIEFGYQYSLRKRMKELTSSISPDSLRRMSPKQNNGDYFTKRIVEARNYFTHYDELNRPQSFTGGELDKAVERLKLLLILLLMKEIGVDDQETLSLVEQSWQYSHIKIYPRPYK